MRVLRKKTALLAKIKRLQRRATEPEQQTDVMVPQRCVYALWFLALTVASDATARLAPSDDASVGLLSSSSSSSSDAAGALYPTSSSSSSHAGRQLQQSAFCPDGCMEGFCVQDATVGGLRCTKCKNNLRVRLANGKCGCSAGFYSDAANRDMCLDCPYNFTCPGGDYSYASPPAKEPCPTGMLTQVMRAGDDRACVNPPGYFLSYDAANVPFISPCPADTFCRGYSKQRQCTPCPTGFSTDGLTMQSRPTACVVPAGYYLKAPGQAAPCPRGEWKAGSSAAGNCTKCPFGVTTLKEASKASSDCAYVEPAYYPSKYDPVTGEVSETKLCPQNYYCPGGKPTQAVTPKAIQAAAGGSADLLTSSPDVLATTAQGAVGSGGEAGAQGALLATEPTIKLCPDGLWTQELGSVDPVQCLTPPGHFTSGGETKLCPSGSYRADWKPPAEAASCRSCGEGVFTDRTDVVVKWDPLTYVATEVAITTAPEDCYIKPGQGLYFTTLTSTWRSRNCMGDEYGVPNKTYGLSPSPCKPCPTNMVARSDRATYPNSASYYVTNGDTPLTGGFTDTRACVTQDGFGMSARGAQQCMQGFYNPKDTYSACAACDFGTTTAGVGRGFTQADCGIAKGFGLVDGKIQTCPIGTYNDKDYIPNLTTPCTACPTGSTTSKAGGDAANSCNLCLPGYGGTNCASQCGGPNNPTYGTAGREFGSACTDCAVAETGFSFTFGWENDAYAPRTVAPLGADAPQKCLAEFGQMVDGAWWLPTTGNTSTTIFPNTASFDACVARCSSSTCQYVTYDYVSLTCYVRSLAGIVYVGEPIIGFKGIPSGDVGTNAASKRGSSGSLLQAPSVLVDATAGGSGGPLVDSSGPLVETAAISSGMYTFYQEPTALDVGIQTAAPGRNSFTKLQDCLNACDNDYTCAGVTVQLTVALADRPKTCQLIRGVVQNGEFKRSMTRMDITRLAIPPLQ